MLQVEINKTYNSFESHRWPKLLIVCMLLFHFGINDIRVDISDSVIEIVDNSTEDDKDSEENLLCQMPLELQIPRTRRTCFMKQNKRSGFIAHFGEIHSPPPERL